MWPRPRVTRPARNAPLNGVPSRTSAVDYDSNFKRLWREWKLLGLPPALSLSAVHAEVVGGSMSFLPPACRWPMPSGRSRMDRWVYNRACAALSHIEPSASALSIVRRRTQGRTRGIGRPSTSHHHPYLLKKEKEL